jgi:hypothetical protein
MALASTGNTDGVAVVGCGVLGTSLCKQILECPDFEGRQGELISGFVFPFCEILAHVALPFSHWDYKDNCSP